MRSKLHKAIFLVVRQAVPFAQKRTAEVPGFSRRSPAQAPSAPNAAPAPSSTLSTLRGLVLLVGAGMLMLPAAATPLVLIDPYDAPGTQVVSFSGENRVGAATGNWLPGTGVLDHQLPIGSYTRGGRHTAAGGFEALDSMDPQAASTSFGRAHVDTASGVMRAELQRPTSTYDAASLTSAALLTRQLPTALDTLVLRDGTYAAYAPYGIRAGIQILDQRAGALQYDNRLSLGHISIVDDGGDLSWEVTRWTFSDAGFGAEVLELGRGIGAFDFSSLDDWIGSVVNGRSDDYFFNVYLNLRSSGYCVSGAYTCDDPRSAATLSAQFSFADAGQVPEPTSLALLLTALSLALGLRLRQRRVWVAVVQPNPGPAACRPHEP